MNAFQSKISLDKLRELVLEQTVDEGYVTMAARQSTNSLLKFPEIREVVNELESLRKLDAVYVMVNTMPPFKDLPWHQDWLEPTPLQPYKAPLIERWHLPVVTNARVVWFDKDHPDGYHMKRGYWCGPVPYWNKHKVENYSPLSRVHLIVDLDCPEPMGMYE